jgi:preprotein translocase subunit YajC
MSSAALLPLLLLGVIFYALMIRPQRSAKRRRDAMMAQLSEGDEIVTIGGMYGTVRDITDDTVEIEIARGVRVRMARRAISAITQDQLALNTASEDAAPDEDDSRFSSGDAAR